MNTSPNTAPTTRHDPAAEDLERKRASIADLGHDCACSSTPPSKARPPRKQTASAPSPDSSPAAAAGRRRSPRQTSSRAAYGYTAPSPAPAARSRPPCTSRPSRAVSPDGASSVSPTKDHPDTTTAASAPWFQGMTPYGKG